MKLKNTEKEQWELYKHFHYRFKVFGLMLIIPILIIIIFESINTYKQYKDKKHNIKIEKQIEVKKGDL